MEGTTLIDNKGDKNANEKGENANSKTQEAEKNKEETCLKEYSENGKLSLTENRMEEASLLTWAICFYSFGDKIVFVFGIWTENIHKILPNMTQKRTVYIFNETAGLYVSSELLTSYLAGGGTVILQEP